MGEAKEVPDPNASKKTSLQMAKTLIF